MSQGHQRTPVRNGSGPGVQVPPLPGLPEEMWPEALRPLAQGTASQFASCPLDRGVTASGAARDFTRQILGSWGLLVLAEDATVIVSELVTNALRHGAQPANGAGHDRVELILLRQPGQMVCAVTDPGAEPPVKAAPDPSAEAGRGLHVIEALAAAWGWARVDAHKKAVWATLALPGVDGGNGHVDPPGLSRRVQARGISRPAARPPGAARSRPGSSRPGAAACCAGPGA
jgi:anti-sigma regulatory factor (Ser/Thr protein kinase)